MKEPNWYLGGQAVLDLNPVEGSCFFCVTLAPYFTLSLVLTYDLLEDRHIDDIINIFLLFLYYLKHVTLCLCRNTVDLR